MKYLILPLLIIPSLALAVSDSPSVCDWHTPCSGGGGGGGSFTDTGSNLTPTGGEGLILGGNGDDNCDTDEVCINTDGTVDAAGVNIVDKTVAPGNGIVILDNNSGFSTACADIGVSGQYLIWDVSGLSSTIEPAVCSGATELFNFTRPPQTVRWTFNDSAGIANGDCLRVNESANAFDALANCNLHNHGQAFHTAGNAIIDRIDCNLDNGSWSGGTEQLDFEVWILEDGLGTVGIDTNHAVTVVQSASGDTFVHFEQATPFQTTETDGAFVLRVANSTWTSGAVRGACVLTYH